VSIKRIFNLWLGPDIEPLVCGGCLEMFSPFLAVENGVLTTTSSNHPAISQSLQTKSLHLAYKSYVQAVARVIGKHLVVCGPRDGTVATLRSKRSMC
jgi:hypothetical protein